MFFQYIKEEALNNNGVRPPSRDLLGEVRGLQSFEFLDKYFFTNGLKTLADSEESPTARISIRLTKGSEKIRTKDLSFYPMWTLMVS
jgi:hypothetical protein